jgi:hypothetical protein
MPYDAVKFMEQHQQLSITGYAILNHKEPQMIL